MTIMPEKREAEEASETRISELSQLREPQAGEEARDFTLRDQNGEEVSLNDFRGRKVVLYFYPKDFTPGCTTEASDFRNSYSDFQRENAVILGVSTDSVESHKRFAERYDLPFRLLSDPDASVAKTYGVYKEKAMFGKKRWGVVRSTFIIDEALRIAKIYRSVRVKDHCTSVLVEVRSAKT